MNAVSTIKQSIDYIEERLGEELTLSRIAKAMFYSEYHFHRTFCTLSATRSHPMCGNGDCRRRRSC